MFRGKDRQRDSFKDGAEHQNLSGTRSCRESRSDKKESSYQGRASRSNHPPGHYRHRCLPVVENETEAGSEPIPCGAYSGHTTHERRRILQGVGLAIALSSSDPSARSLRPGLTATEIHSLWRVLHPAREARARHSTVARRFERAITLAPPPSASTAAYLDGPLPAQLDREPESRDEGNRDGDHPRRARDEVGIDHHRESRDELRRAPRLLAVEEDAQADESGHHRREERGRVEAHRRGVSGVRLGA